MIDIDSVDRQLKAMFDYVKISHRVSSLTHKIGGYSDPGLVVENIEVAHVEGSVRLVIDHVDGGDPAGHRGAEQNHLHTKYIFQESLQIKCLGSKMRLQHIDCDGNVYEMTE